MIIKSGHDLDGILTSLYEALGLPLLQAYGCNYGASGLSIPLFNGVVECNLPAFEVEVAVREIAKHFTANGLPYSWWVAKKSEPYGLREALQAQGLALWGELLGLTVQLDNAVAPASLQTVAMVESGADYNEWNQVVCSCWGFSESDTQKHYAMYQKQQIPLWHVVGRKDGQIVAAGSLLCHKGGSYIYNLATLPEARRQGFATSVLWTLIQLAKEHGYTQVGLQTLPELVPLFHKLGFRQTSGFTLYALTK